MPSLAVRTLTSLESPRRFALDRSYAAGTFGLSERSLPAVKSWSGASRLESNDPVND
jgi:hypothetical protein